MNVTFCNCQPHNQPTTGCSSVMLMVMMMMSILSNSVFSNMISASFVVICHGLDGSVVHWLSYKPFMETILVKSEAREDGENCCEVMMPSGGSTLVNWWLDYSCNGEPEVVRGRSAIRSPRRMNTKWSAWKQ